MGLCKQNGLRYIRTEPQCNYHMLIPASCNGYEITTVCGSAGEDAETLFSRALHLRKAQMIVEVWSGRINITLSCHGVSVGIQNILPLTGMSDHGLLQVN